MRKTGRPSRGELVVCKIIKLFPNSAFAKLIEYDDKGMIHVSEVTRRWVRDIREFLKEGQYVVCRVMYTDRETISLSIKRVRREQAASKLSEFKREKKAERMLELVAKKLNKNIDQAYDEVGFKLQEEFGSLSKTFEFALKNPDMLKTKGIPKTWADSIVEIAKKKYVEKTYRVKAELNLFCYKPNGIEVVKEILSRTKGVEVKYISAPKYTVTGTGKNYKEVESAVSSACEKIVKEINQNDGEASFKIKE